MKADKKAQAADDALPDPTIPPQPLPPELCEHVGFMIGKARQELLARLNPVVAPLGLNIKHFGILLLLLRRGALRQTELAGLVRLDRTTVTNMVDELEQAGFVRREPDPRDRRANAVTATPKGRKWLEKIRPTAEKIERDFLSPLSAAEQDRLRELLLRLVAHGQAA